MFIVATTIGFLYFSDPKQLPTDARSPYLAASLSTLDTIHLIVLPGWNLISLPVTVGDGRTAVLFPTSTSHASIPDRIRNNTSLLGNMPYHFPFIVDVHQTRRLEDSFVQYQECMALVTSGSKVASAHGDSCHQ